MTVPETASPRRFVWPAEYYASPSPQAVLPPWATFGCAAGAALIVLLVFVGAQNAELFMDIGIGTAVAEMKRMYAKDVTAERKKSLDAAITAMRSGMRDRRIQLARVQAFLETMQQAVADKRVTGTEARDLEELAKKASASTVRR